MTTRSSSGARSRRFSTASGRRSGMAFTVRDGRLCRDGTPMLALGVNYFPSEAGCRMWVDWDLPAIRDDFARMADAGLNTVRIFLIWRDFEPTEGRIDSRMVDRLAQAVAAAGEAGLGCVISLFTIWMDGQRLDLSWRRGRSPWRDNGLLAREESLARTVAVAVRPFDNVLAIDLGDEIANIDPVEADTLSAAEVAGWYERLAGVLRQEAPGILVLQANDASGVFGSSGFGVDNAAALDLAGTHGFPTWAPGSIESTMSYKATNLTSFLVGFAAAHGVPFVDELGSYGVDEATAAASLHPSVPPSG